MADAHANFSISNVATAPSPATSGTSLVVQSGDGAKFPAASFNATVWPAGAQPTTANAEIVRVTNISTDTFTITRAQESSSARTIVVGDQIAATITKKTLTDIEAGVNGLNSATTVVGVSAATAPSSGQVLTATSSTAATWQTPSGGSSTPRWMTEANIANGPSYWKQTAGGSSIIALSGNPYTMSIKATASSTIFGYGSPTQNANIAAAGFKNLTGSCLVAMTQVGGSNGQGWLKWFSDGATSTYNTVTGNNIGLYGAITSSGTVGALSSTTGNGTTGSTTTLSSSTPLGTDRLVTMQQNASDVKFYVDGTLKNTHSTNLPTLAGSSNFFGFYVQEQSGVNNVAFALSHMGLQGDLY